MSYGADDYITKPYNQTILLLRIATIFKRCETNNISYKDFTFDISKGIESILEGSIITFMFLILIYGIYFLITYLCSKNIIRERI